MADIQIPQRTVPNYSFQQPDLSGIAAIYNRPKPAELGAQLMGQGVNSALENYYKQQQLKAAAFEAGGPYLMNQLYGNGKQPVAPLPQTGDSNQNPTQQPGVGGGTPTNGMQSPQGTAQTMPGQGQGQPSIDPHAPGGTIHTSVNSLGNPDIGGIHAAKIQALQQQMGQNAQMGKYGQTLNVGLKDQLSAEQALMGQEQFQQSQARQQNQFEQSQNAEESRFQRGQGQKRAEAIANKGAEQKPAQIQVDLLQKSFKDLDSSLQKYYSGPAIPGSGNLAKATGGHIGSKAGKSVIEDSEALVSNLNKALTSRFGLAGQSLLSESYKVSPNETPDSAASKMSKIHSVINILDSANKEQIANFIETLNGQANGR